jgi:hypothetical protein
LEGPPGGGSQAGRRSGGVEPDIDRIVAQLATAGIFGGDLDRIEQRMTWPRWMTICEEWAEWPPAHLTLAAVHMKRTQKAEQGDLGELMGIFG